MGIKAAHAGVHEAITVVGRRRAQYSRTRLDL